MTTMTKTLATLTTAGLIAGGAANADILTVDLDETTSIGGNANGDIFTAFADNTTEIDGITTTDNTGWSGNANSVTMTYTSEVTDVGNPFFGLVFTFDVTLEGFVNDGSGGLTAVNARKSAGVAVDSILGGEDRNQIDSAAKLGTTEYEQLRATIGNAQIVTAAGGAVSISTDGFIGQTIRHQGEASLDEFDNPIPTGEAGTIFIAGTSTELDTWGPDGEGYREYTTFAPTLATDIVATGKEGTLQGFSAQFDVLVPEPGSLALLGLGGLLIAGRRRRA